MEHPSLPTIRMRFFITLIILGLVMTIIGAAGISGMNVLFMRELTIDNLKHYAHAMSGVAKTNITDPPELARHLRDFGHEPGLTMSCIYGENNMLIASWKSPSTHKPCPVLIGAPGVQATFLDVKIAHRIGDKEHYKGMLYIEGHLTEFRTLLMRALATMAVLIMLSLGICLILAHFAARRISEPLHLLYEQVQCLLNKNADQCALPPRARTQETSLLFQAITELRHSIQSTMTPKAEMENVHHWYRGVIFGLIALLRRRLAENSPLLPAVSDYALLLRIDGGASMPKPDIFQLSQVCDRALASAKKIQPPPPEVYVTLSIKPETPPFWIGQEELVEALLRNLLLVSFTHTRRGMIRLRLEASMHPITQQQVLTYMLEDSGNSVSTGSFQANLQRYSETMNATNKQMDISWTLLSRLPPLLGSALSTEVHQNNSQRLFGYINLKEAVFELQSDMTMNGKGASTAMPLVMLVEDDRMNLIVQRTLFEQAHCRVFAVRSATEALEWIKLLPFSAVILDNILPDMNGPLLAERIRSLMHGREIPAIPIWALTASDTPEDREAWQSTGVSIILLKPLAREVLVPLAKSLQPSDDTFFMKYDIAPQEFSPRIMEQLPQLISEMGRQIKTLCISLAREAAAVDSAEAAHALKSAALTLGYGRLAACMDSLEQGLRNDSRLLDPENIAVIQKTLQLNTLSAASQQI